MANPVSVGVMGLDAIAGGTALSAGGSIFSGISQGMSYNYQASVAKQNAEYERQNAAYQIELGITQAQQEGIKGRQIEGAIKAQQGASGLQVGTGSGERVLQSQAEVNKFNQDVIYNRAAWNAYGDAVKAQQYDAQASMYKSAGVMSEISGGIGAVSSVLSGIGSFSSKWMQGKSAGLWDDSGPSSYYPFGNN